MYLCGLLADTTNDLHGVSLGSITGVIAATLLVVEVLKRALDGVAFFKKIPTFVYAIVVAGILALLANKVIKGDSGQPILPGRTLLVVWNAIIAAAASSGFYTWLRNPETMQMSSKLGVAVEPPKKEPKGTSQSIPLLLMGLFLFSGCNGWWDKRAPNDTPLTNDTRIVYTSVLKQLTSLKLAGYITDSEKTTQIEPIRKQVANYLDLMEQAELAGDKSLLSQNKEQLDKWLDQLIAWRTKVEARKTAGNKVASVNHYLLAA